MRPIEEFYHRLVTPIRILVTMHQKPDADALGSALGLKLALEKMGHQVSVVAPTNWPGFLNWLPGCAQVIDFESRKQAAEQLIGEAEVIFCLDFNDLSRTRNMEPFIRDARAERILIDHHQEPQVQMFAFGKSDTGKGSTAEMVFDFIVDAGYRHLIDSDIATCLYAGAMTDTGSFRFPSTTASVHRMVADLKEIGFEHHKVHEHIFDTFLENRLRFFGHVLLNRMDVNYELNTVLISVPKNDLLRFDIKTGDTEGLVNYPLSMLGIKLAAIVIDRDEERKWSFRSKGDIDVNRFAKEFFEGGGHKNAAGGRSTLSLEECIAHFKKVLPTMSDKLRSEE
ncbi:MAG TPA: bifunctional oligoribonuclease/PAP phosphatase NrnA [Phnomibacter sp.]|nr:bifunctional oligoribonuclease/PAP phosphatase NrnA [Phnomibacter sp.]